MEVTALDLSNVKNGGIWVLSWVVAQRGQSQDDDGIQGRGAVYEPDANIQSTRESDWIVSLMMITMKLRAHT